MTAGQEMPVMKLILVERLAQTTAYVEWENACVIQTILEMTVMLNAQDMVNFIRTDAFVMRAL